MESHYIEFSAQRFHHPRHSTFITFILDRAADFGQFHLFLWSRDLSSDKDMILFGKLGCTTSRFFQYFLGGFWLTMDFLA